jgi:hypothetical protein
VKSIQNILIAVIVAILIANGNITINPSAKNDFIARVASSTPPPLIDYQFSSPNAAIVEPTMSNDDLAKLEVGELVLQGLQDSVNFKGMPRKQYVQKISAEHEKEELPFLLMGFDAGQKQIAKSDTPAKGKAFNRRK